MTAQAIRNAAGKITVIQVIREMGYEPNKEFDWRAGKMMQELYLRLTGELPGKDLGYKTFRKGVHCFAQYDPVWRSTIRALILNLKKTMALEKAQQPELFQMLPEPEERAPELPEPPKAEDDDDDDEWGNSLIL